MFKVYYNNLGCLKSQISTYGERKIKRAKLSETEAKRFMDYLSKDLTPPNWSKTHWFGSTGERALMIRAQPWQHNGAYIIPETHKYLGDERHYEEQKHNLVYVGPQYRTIELPLTPEQHLLLTMERENMDHLANRIAMFYTLLMQQTDFVYLWDEVNYWVRNYLENREMLLQSFIAGVCDACDDKDERSRARQIRNEAYFPRMMSSLKNWLFLLGGAEAHRRWKHLLDRFSLESHQLFIASLDHLLRRPWSRFHDLSRISEAAKFTEKGSVERKELATQFAQFRKRLFEEFEEALLRSEVRVLRILAQKVCLSEQEKQKQEEETEEKEVLKVQIPVLNVCDPRKSHPPPHPSCKRFPECQIFLKTVCAIEFGPKNKPQVPLMIGYNLTDIDEFLERAQAPGSCSAFLLAALRMQQRNSDLFGFRPRLRSYAKFYENTPPSKGIGAFEAPDMGQNSKDPSRADLNYHGSGHYFDTYCSQLVVPFEDDQRPNAVYLGKFFELDPGPLLALQLPVFIMLPYPHARIQEDRVIEKIVGLWAVCQRHFERCRAQNLPLKQKHWMRKTRKLVFYLYMRRRREDVHDEKSLEGRVHQVLKNAIPGYHQDRTFLVKHRGEREADILAPLTRIETPIKYVFDKMEISFEVSELVAPDLISKSSWCSSTNLSRQPLSG